MKDKLLRMFFLPLGLVRSLVEAAKAGARDIHNRKRFPQSIIDPGCCISQGSVISANTHVLRDSLVLGSKIAEYSYIGENSVVQNAEVGKFCSIASGVFIGTGKHPLNLFSTSPLFYRKKNTFGIELIDDDLEFEEYKKIEIGHDVWIGTRAMVMDGVAIGNGAMVAANAVVTKDVPPYAVVGGVPARVIKYRFSEERINELLASTWWEWSLNEIKEKMLGNFEQENHTE